jgi:hypothetical protein
MRGWGFVYLLYLLACALQYRYLDFTMCSKLLNAQVSETVAARCQAVPYCIHGQLSYMPWVIILQWLLSEPPQNDATERCSP